MFDKLILVESTTSKVQAGFCWYCDGAVMVTPYYRSESQVSLHKECGDLPKEMVHERHHPEHTLRLHIEGEERDGVLKRCSVCRDKAGTYYECSACDGDFFLDAKCAVKSFPFSHNCHPQHPIIANLDQNEEFQCVVCNDSVRAVSYQCTTCAFRVHQKCAVSRKITLAIHSHELDFIICSSVENTTRMKKPVCCRICREELEYAFHCATCDVSFHPYNCRTASHPCHSHPLVLLEEQRSATSDYLFGDCNGCGSEISLPYYACFTEFCALRLHKYCADLPHEVKHHLHPEHALTLAKGTKSYGDDELAESSFCNVCHVPWEGFGYSCSANESCPFSMDIVCAMKTSHLKYKFHEHPLFPSPTKASSACRACNEHNEGPTYQCTTCRFWVHQQCASAPAIVKRDDLHPHNLKLNYSLSPKENTKRFRCHVCREDIKLYTWAYQCAVGCRYFTHVHDCSDPNRMIEEIDPALAVHLPVANEFVSLETLFFMDINGVVAKGLEAESQDGNGGEHTRKMLFLDPYETCDKCSQLLSPPCKNCTLCKYFLSKSPAELVGPYPYEGYGSMLKNEETLEEICDGFGINVDERGPHVKISSSVLPCYVKHEGHNHVLSTTCFTNPAWCNSCDGDFTGYGFLCNICDFTLCTYCTLMPRSVSHGYDKKHGFKLTYYSIEDVEEYVCEICEKDISSSWFYHCVECDQSIHPNCIWKIEISFGSCVNIYNDQWQFRTILHHMVIVPTIKFPSLDCLFCQQDDTSGCSYSVFGERWNAHVQCVSRGEMDRWHDARNELRLLRER